MRCVLPSVVLSVLGLGLFAAAAKADDAPPAPQPPTPAPTAPDDGRRVVDMAPPQAPATAPAPMGVAPCPPPANPCCPDNRCLQKRDECGWPLDTCGNRMGCIDLTLEGMATWISSPDGPLGELVAGNTDPLEWNHVDYPVAWGGRGTLSWRVEPETRIELRGTYWGNPNDKNAESGFFGATPGSSGLGDLSQPVDATMKSEAQLWGLEFNGWGEVLCRHAFRLDVGAGFRYVSFDERAHVDFVGTGPGPFPVAPGAFVDSKVTNNFYGGQVGVVAHDDFSDCLEGYAGLKILFGQVSRDIKVTDDSIFAGGPHSSRLKDDEFVLGADFELGFKWHMTPRISLTGGYELFLLDGVQRANDALDFSHSTTGAVQARQSTDQVLAHSLFLGVSFNF